MRSNIVTLIIFSFYWINAKSQSSDNGLLTTLFKSQKDYLNTNIQEKQKPKYLTLLHFAKVIHPKVFDEILAL